MAKDDGSKLLLVGALGLGLGAYLESDRRRKQRLSRAEREAPDLVAAVAAEVGELLEDCVLLEEYEREADFRDAIADYLEEHSDLSVEVEASTREGRPDILIEAVLALELKLRPKRTHLQRAVGQTAEYARRWMTWLVLADTSESKVQHLMDLLEDSDMDHVAVWALPFENDDDDGGDE